MWIALEENLILYSATIMAKYVIYHNQEKQEKEETFILR
jgi:hypothetical protein